MNKLDSSNRFFVRMIGFGLLMAVGIFITCPSTSATMQTQPVEKSLIQTFFRLCRQGKGVTPFQLGKTRKIRISSGQFATMFDGKSGQMCVCNQIGYSLPTREHRLKYRPMSFRRSNESCTRLVQPALYTSKGLFKGERVIEDPRIGPDPNKGGQNCPA